jgi:dUTPase
MINWKEIAEQNGLSPNDFAVEIFSATDRGCGKFGSTGVN